MPVVNVPNLGWKPLAVEDEDRLVLGELSTFPSGIHEKANEPPSTSLLVHRSPNRLLRSDIDNPLQSCSVIVGELRARETLGL